MPGFEDWEPPLPKMNQQKPAADASSSTLPKNNISAMTDISKDLFGMLLMISAVGVLIYLWIVLLDYVNQLPMFSKPFKWGQSDKKNDELIFKPMFRQNTENGLLAPGAEMGVSLRPGSNASFLFHPPKEGIMKFDCVDWKNQRIVSMTHDFQLPFKPSYIYQRTGSDKFKETIERNPFFGPHERYPDPDKSSFRSSSYPSQGTINSSFYPGSWGNYDMERKEMFSYPSRNVNNYDQMNATIPNSWNSEFQRSRSSNASRQNTTIPNTWNMEVQGSERASHFGRNLATNPGNTWNREVPRAPSTFGHVTPNWKMDQRTQRTNTFGQGVASTLNMEVQGSRKNSFGQNGTTTNPWNTEIQRPHSAKKGWDELNQAPPRSQLHLRKNTFGLVD